jgi:predicted transcriptional regulator
MQDKLERILSELEIIRKLKMLEIVEKGYSQSKIAAALGVSQATVSRMMADKKVNPTKRTLGNKIDES